MNGARSSKHHVSQSGLIPREFPDTKSCLMSTFPWWCCWGSLSWGSWWTRGWWTLCPGGRWSPWTRTCQGAASAARAPSPPLRSVCPPPGSRCSPRSGAWCTLDSGCAHAQNWGQRRGLRRSRAWSWRAASGASSPAPPSPPSRSGLPRSAASRLFGRCLSRPWIKNK